MNWLRVNRQRRCPVCSKDSWCLLSPDGQKAFCMRQTSERSHTFKDGSVGYFHNVSGEPVAVKREERPALVINVGKLMESWAEQTEWSMIVNLATQLGVMPTALGKIGCAWAREHRAWAFVMKDGFGNMVGIRLRSNDGNKWAVRGSHSGIFFCEDAKDRLALIVEGPTDASAGLSLGFFTIGRPSCSGGMHDVITALRRLRVNRAVIVADNDDPGVNGAKMLQEHLRIPSVMLVLPCKDCREFVKLGGTQELLRSMIDQLVWKQP